MRPGSVRARAWVKVSVSWLGRTPVTGMASAAPGARTTGYGLTASGADWRALTDVGTPCHTQKAEAANAPAKALTSPTLAVRCHPMAYAWNTTFVSVSTICAKRAASQFVSLTQPWLSARPMVSGAGVPWMP